MSRIVCLSLERLVTPSFVYQWRHLRDVSKLMLSHVEIKNKVVTSSFESNMARSLLFSLKFK